MSLCFALIVASNAYKSFRIAQSVASLVLYSKKKNIPNNTTPTFQKVGGVTLPLTFCRWHKNLSWYRVNHNRFDWFLLSMYFLFICLPPFSIEMNQNVNSLLNLLCPWGDNRSYLPFILVYKISFGFNTKNIKCT